MMDHPGLVALLGVCALIAGAAMLAVSGRREREMTEAGTDPHIGDSLLLLIAVITGTGGVIAVVLGLIQLFETVGW